MHCSTHLRECLRDFGPAPVFWLFGFERYNGMLEQENTLMSDVEVSTLRAFMRRRVLRELQPTFPSLEASERGGELVQSLRIEDKPAEEALAARDPS